MVAPGETDLAAMLETLDAQRRPGTYCFVAVTSPTPEELAVAQAVVVESESTTLVVDVGEARRRGWEIVGEMAWLTLSVASSLDAVGLTAAFSRMLTDEGISCNVLAGFHHDHILVPVADVDRAIHTLRGSGRDLS